jgi:DNA polymerase III subunit beta
MKITVPRDTILGPLSKAVGLAGGRSTMPVLANVLVELGPESRFTATNLETTVIAKLNFSVEETRTILLPANKFHEILRLLDPADVNYDLNDGTLVITQGSSEFIIVLAGDVEDFPNVRINESLVASVKMKSSDFLKAINKVAYAVSHDETRHILTGAYIEGKDGMITTVGTDGFRMAVNSMTIKGDVTPFPGQIIPKKALGTVMNIVSSAPDVTVNIHQKNISVVTESFTVNTTKIEGDFPDYTNVIPQTNGCSAFINTQAFLKALKKVSTIATKGDVLTVAFCKDKLHLNLESDIGIAKESIEAQVVGIDEEISSFFNLRYLSDALSNIDEETVTVYIPHTYGAYLFVPGGNDSYKNVVMPVKI